MSDVFENSAAGIWDDDLLDRKSDAEFIQTFLTNRLSERQTERRPRSYVFNIDASWGAGKTYFLERLRLQLLEAGHPVAFVNAWKDDHTDEPLTAVMAAVDAAVTDLLDNKAAGLKSTFEAVRRNFGAILLSGLKGGGKALAQRYLGQSMEEIAQAIREQGQAHGDAMADAVFGAGEGMSSETSRKIDTLFDQAGSVALSNFHVSAKAIETFKDSLAEVVETLEQRGRKPPLFVLVDELDRCRPLYAIELLERIKHIFSIEGVAFIVATDTDQLRHSIKAVYGAQFDSHRYLHRFFDRVYKFADPDKRRFIEFLLSSAPIAEHKCRVPGGVEVRAAIHYTYSYFDGALTLRDIEQVHEILRTITTTWSYPIKLELLYVLPLLIGWKRGISPARLHASASDLFDLASKSPPTSPFRFGGDYRSKPSHFDLREFFLALHHARNTPLEEAGANLNEHTSQPDKFAYMALSEEFSRFHGNTYIPGKKLWSKLRNYPKWIEMAGRMESA